MFYPLKTSENFKVYRGKKSTLAYNALATWDKFLNHIATMFYFLPLGNIRKPYSLQKFSGVQKWNIGSILVEVNMFYTNISHWLITSSETMVLANPDVVNEFYEHPASF